MIEYVLSTHKVLGLIPRPTNNQNLKYLYQDAKFDQWFSNRGSFAT